MPLQNPKPPEQKHTPLTHCSLVPQRRPHEPQLLKSPCRSTHPPLHDVSPIGHMFTQLPLSHCWPMPQTRPHMPQLLGSAAGNTHLLPHATYGAVHRHCEFTHVEPTPPHALPHEPQLFTSAWVNVHVPLHCC